MTPLRLIHTGDWHVGKPFRFVDDPTGHLLRDARLEAITSLGRLARAHHAPVVLVAGDAYDHAELGDRTLAQPLERMRRFPDITWHVIPGNHDPHRPNGIWERAVRRLPANVQVHLEAAPTALAENVWLLPSPLHRRATTGDPTGWMDTAATPAGTIRIGLAHGSITDFGSDRRSAPNVIAPDRPAQAGLSYLALGDWHGTKRIGARCWYAGTPEIDDFGVVDGGQALLVTIDGSDAPPVVEPLAVGRYLWRRQTAALFGLDDIGRLVEQVRALAADPAQLLVDLTVEGILTLAGRAAFDADIGRDLAAALCHLSIDDRQLHAAPSPDDLDTLAGAGFVRTAAERLRALNDDPTAPEHPLAEAALLRLYLEQQKLDG